METIVLAGGTGFLGTCLLHHYSTSDTNIIVLTRGTERSHGKVRFVNWDGKHPGAWTQFLEGVDALINLNGKSVDCRYTKKNMKLIYSTRLDATMALGEADLQCRKPPRLWINSSSATIYKDSRDRPMDEYTGEQGSGFSVDVCQKWEEAFNVIKTPSTRKVIIRTAIVLGKHGGALAILKRLARLGAGGKQGSGDQYVSWLHENDFISLIDFIITNENISGVYNLAAPNPIPNHKFMKALRTGMRVHSGIPIPQWLLTLGAVLIRTEPELVLKSRRVVPRKMLDAGYQFKFDKIENALKDLCNT